MDSYEEEVREMERTRASSAVPPCPVVFYGSSSMRLWTTLPEDLGGGSDIVNAAFGGSTLEACAHFYERLIAPLQPRSLVVYAGDNDLGNGCPPYKVLEFFRRLILQTGGIPSGFLSVKISPARVGLTDRIRETNSLIQEEIAQHPEAYYVDISEAMLDPNGQPRTEYFMEDGLHLSPPGYKVWARILREYRNRIFTPDCADVNAGKVALGEHEPGVSQVVQSPSQA